MPKVPHSTPIKGSLQDPPTPQVKGLNLGPADYGHCMAMNLQWHGELVCFEHHAPVVFHMIRPESEPRSSLPLYSLTLPLTLTLIRGS